MLSEMYILIRIISWWDQYYFGHDLNDFVFVDLACLAWNRNKFCMVLRILIETKLVVCMERENWSFWNEIARDSYVYLQ